MKRDGARHSLWQDTTPGIEEHSSTTNSTSFDVIIAGAGITGLTTGLLLQKAGKSVLIAEAHSIGFGTTGGITAIGCAPEMQQVDAGRYMCSVNEIP